MRCPNLSTLSDPLKNKSGWPWIEGSTQLPNTMVDGKQWPRISIVTPSFNQHQYIEETIRSVLLQGYPNLEYIIIDGGSTDGSVEIIRKYESWLTYLHIGKDDGQADAISKGFQKATGVILAWINSDDCYRPKAFQRVARFFTKHPDIVFANGDVNITDAASRIQQRLYCIRPCPTVTATLGKHCWPQQGCFWRRWAYEKVGGVDPLFQFCMDRDLFIRLASIGPSKRIKGPPLADFRQHPGAKSSKMMNVRNREAAEITAKYSNTILKTKSFYIWFVWKCSIYHKIFRIVLNKKFGLEI